MRLAECIRNFMYHIMNCINRQSPKSAAAVFTGQGRGFAPCTAEACMALLRHYGIDPCGRHAVVIGRSPVVGRPVSMLLLRENATVTVCHTKTPDAAALTRQADIIITAAGAAGGVVVSETLHYAARKQSEKAYATGYDKGKSDAVKQQYWLYVSMQRQRNQVGSVRLYPVQLPEQRIDGVTFQPSTKLLRIEE